MKLKALCLALALPFAIGVQNAQADSSTAIQQMAQILLTMDKTPDAKQRETLQGLANSAPSANEQRLAKGILSINGTISDEGKQEVWSVLRQISAADSERELAKIINRFEGSANNADKARLSALTPAQADQKSDKAAKKVDKKNEKTAKKEEKK